MYRSRRLSNQLKACRRVFFLLHVRFISAFTTRNQTTKFFFNNTKVTSVAQAIADFGSIAVGALSWAATHASSVGATHLVLGRRPFLGGWGMSSVVTRIMGRRVYLELLITSESKHTREQQELGLCPSRSAPLSSWVSVGEWPWQCKHKRSNKL